MSVPKRYTGIAAFTALAFAPFATCTNVFAQDDEELFELSPFTVEAGQDRGYRATSTLAGTRLNTQLRDIGSAISVMTEAMFEDTGATDAETILSYGLNTEVSGVNGNFADGLGSNHNGRA
jgi:outer membrane receptor for ferric coprogen and ferric-rhodotorulic acid